MGPPPSPRLSRIRFFLIMSTLPGFSETCPSYPSPLCNPPTQLPTYLPTTGLNQPTKQTNELCFFSYSFAGFGTFVAVTMNSARCYSVPASWTRQCTGLRCAVSCTKNLALQKGYLLIIKPPSQMMIT